MFAKWLEEYQRLSNEMRFVSKLGTFLVSLFAILSLYNIAHFFYLGNYGVQILFEIQALLPAVIFQSVIFLVFAAKFASLFFKSEKAFVFNQILWMTGIILLVTYWYCLRLEPLSFGIYSTVPEPFFRHSSPVFSTIAVVYLILSPLRQITTIVIAFIKSK